MTGRPTELPLPDTLAVTAARPTPVPSLPISGSPRERLGSRGVFSAAASTSAARNPLAEPVSQGQQAARRAREAPLGCRDPGARRCGRRRRRSAVERVSGRSSATRRRRGGSDRFGGIGRLAAEDQEQDRADRLAEDDDQRPDPLATADRDPLGRRLEQDHERDDPAASAGRGTERPTPTSSPAGSDDNALPYRSCDPLLSSVGQPTGRLYRNFGT